MSVSERSWPGQVIKPITPVETTNHEDRIFNFAHCNFRSLRCKLPKVLRLRFASVVRLFSKNFRVFGGEFNLHRFANQRFVTFNPASSNFLEYFFPTHTDEVRGVDYIAKGCAPVDICATIEQTSSLTISCAQCSEDLCNDKPSTPARKPRTVRAAPRWWSKLKDSTPPPPVETTSTKQKRGIGPWLDAGSEILRFVNNRMESEAAAVAQAQAQAHAQAMALSSGSRLYLSSFILILSIFKFIF